MARLRQVGNLPAELSSFVGRDHEVSEVVRLLSTARLVTLVGAAGVGKTRVAVRAARDARRAFPDGVWLVELAALADAALLAHTVADTLGVDDLDLVDHLLDKRSLLVLDNCEHVFDACVCLVHRLLEAAPGLRVLATSRHVLGVPGEHLVDVLPLSVPDPDQPWPAAAKADRYDAIRLFVERAAAVRPGFELTDDNVPAVAGICTVLEGIPLAVEMAAWRTHALPAKEILARLGDRFALLSTGSPVPSARHRTLSAAIGWSFDLCTPAEQLLWTRLSVFSGGFDLAAAEAVCAGDAIAHEDVVDLVVDLTHKSVLTRQDHDTHARYRMLDSVRDYGRARLRHADDGVLRRRHRDWYHRLATRAGEEWFGPHQPDWRARLSHELANVRLALDHCLEEPGARQTGLAMVTALWSQWIACGAVGEGHRGLTRALAAAPEPTPARATALWLLGWVAQLRGDGPAARAALEEGRALAERLGDRPAMAYALQYAGYAAMAAGDHSSALARYEDALARHRDRGDEVGVTTALCELALCHCLRGALDTAVTLCAECVGRCAERGETWCRSSAFHVRGMALWLGGHHEEAERAVRDGITLKRPLNDVLGIGMSLELLAWIAAAEGDHRRAARLSGAARPVWQAVGAPLGGIHQLLEHREHAERQLAAALGTTAFEAALREGTSLTLDEAVSYALAEDVPPSPPTPRAVPNGAAAQLTRREWEVADLVADGMSNKDIATALGVVPRTAETHVQHILAKLGFTSRARLAAWVAEQRVDRDT